MYDLNLSYLLKCHFCETSFFCHILETYLKRISEMQIFEIIAKLLAICLPRAGKQLGTAAQFYCMVKNHRIVAWFKCVFIYS